MASGFWLYFIVLVRNSSTFFSGGVFALLLLLSFIFHFFYYSLSFPSYTIYLPYIHSVNFYNYCFFRYNFAQTFCFEDTLREKRKLNVSSCSFFFLLLFQELHLTLTLVPIPKPKSILNSMKISMDKTLTTAQNTLTPHTKPRSLHHQLQTNWMPKRRRI